MDIRFLSLIGFLGAIAASSFYGYWLGGYAKRHSWDRGFAKRRAPLASYGAFCIAGALWVVLRLQTGITHDELFWMGLGFVLGGAIAVRIVLRRAAL